jgi:hypothetical protein
MKRLAKDKHSSLFFPGVSDAEKSFITLTPDDSSEKKRKTIIYDYHMWLVL